MFAVVSIGLVAVVPAALLRKVRRGVGLMTNVDALLGEKATLLERGDRHGGQVKLSGAAWSVRAIKEAQVLEPGRTDIVLEINGETALVLEEP